MAQNTRSFVEDRNIALISASVRLSLRGKESIRKDITRHPGKISSIEQDGNSRKRYVYIADELLQVINRRICALNIAEKSRGK
ncbi:hypothetical protein [Faecalimonas umbilicata]|uniref:hypothetical protein n=1 Tax=Faecalimonas umbilicata TaxID=1912855 RepID=UPI0022E13E0F|nr:hypothetical protein [Faecalimonas umbilicata]